MPLIVRGKSYVLPEENDTQAPTGEEIIAIEDAFDLDGLTLLATLSSPEASKIRGYTRVKALYALAWITMTRAGDVLSVQDVLKEYGIDELEFQVEESGADTKKEAASSEAEPKTE